MPVIGIELTDILLTVGRWSSNAAVVRMKRLAIFPRQQAFFNTGRSRCILKQVNKARQLRMARQQLAHLEQHRALILGASEGVIDVVEECAGVVVLDALCFRRELRRFLYRALGIGLGLEHARFLIGDAQLSLLPDRGRDRSPESREQLAQCTAAYPQ